MTGSNGTPAVRAYGGVPWRAAPAGIEVLLVHRPRYGDWSLPKGKIELGEEPLTCAIREVEEETGVSCEAGEVLGTVCYAELEKHKETAVLKEVTFFEMHPLTSRDRTPDDEVDNMRWLPLGAGRELCTYPTDQQMLDALEALLASRT